jgi:Domain of unknown function (DUF5658)
MKHSRQYFNRLIAVLFVLNVWDMLVTLATVLMKAGRELNPVMDFALDIGPWFFVLVKLAIAGATCGFLSYALERAAVAVRWALYLLLSVYGSVGLLHVYNLVVLALR